LHLGCLVVACVEQLDSLVVAVVVEKLDCLVVVAGVEQFKDCLIVAAVVVKQLQCLGVAPVVEQLDCLVLAIDEVDELEADHHFVRVHFEWLNLGPDCTQLLSRKVALSQGLHDGGG